MPWLHKWLGNPALSFIGRRLYGTPAATSTAGSAASTARRSLALDVRSTGMEFAIEMIVKATMQGLRVTEVPTTLSPDAEGREPHLNTWRDGWKSMRLLLLYSPKWLFLYPGLFLLAVGIAGMAWLIPENRSIGDVGFDVSTLLYFSLAVIVGLQAVFFFLTARWFGITEGLLPEDPLIRRIVERPRRLEWALLVGMLLVASGLGLSLYAVVTWNDAGFGQLDYPDTLRIVIPGATLIACGMQTALLGALPRRAGAAASVKESARRRLRRVEAQRETVRARAASRPLATASRSGGPGRRTAFRSRLRSRSTCSSSSRCDPIDRRRAALPDHRREHRLRRRRRSHERLREPRADAEGRERLPARTSHAAVYKDSGELRPFRGVGLPALLAPGSRARRADRSARLVMLLIAALLADQLYRLLRDLRFRRRYRILAWVAVVFCLPVARLHEPDLPRASRRVARSSSRYE